MIQDLPQGQTQHDKDAESRARIVMTRLSELEALAKAATPGPWKNQPGFNTVYTYSHGETGLTTALASILEHQVTGHHAEATANGNYIAAANPAAILELIALVRLQHDAIIWNWGGEPLPTKELEAIEAFKKWEGE